LNGYTTTSQYPYSENASNLNINMGGLPGSFNYARNSVIAVVNAYTGSMKFYANDPSDPILKAYRSAFPTMFQPMSAMPSTIQSHLRYPSDLFSVEAATYGRYHIKSASAFYSASDRWDVTPTTGAGSPAATLQATQQTNAAGDVISTSLSPMSPIFQVGSLPNANQQQLLETLDFVPAGNSSTVQSLTAFMIATSNADNYGQLNVYETPRGTTVTGPLQADSEIEQTAKVSSTITPLDQHGSTVLLGNNLTVPLDSSVLYIRPLYVSSSSDPMPQLRYVIAVFNQNVSIEPTLDAALSQVFDANITTGSTTTPPTKPGKPSTTTTVTQYLQSAANDYTLAQAALAKGNLGLYQADVEAMNHEIQLAQTALAAAK
jgi:uncharacterized membrane protein (UPF0182 family)